MMLREMRSSGIHLIVLFVIVILSVSLLQVIGEAVGISKSLLRFDAQPGAYEETLLTVENNEGSDIRVRVRLIDWDDTPDGRTLLFSPDTIERSCSSWIEYAPQAFNLRPGQKQEVHVTIRVPSSAVGTYWAALLVDKPAQPDAPPEGGIRAKTQFLIKIYQTSLPASTTGKIASVVVRGLDPLWVTLQFANTGETLMEDVSATATLQDRTGQTLGELSSDPFSVLPGHTVDVALASSLYMQVPGVYLVTAVADYGADYLVAGQVALRIKQLSLSPIGGSLNTPTDLDGDGLYEDIDGDGRLTEADLSLYTSNLDDRCITRNKRAFDYDNDGEITQDDVGLLQAMLSRQQERAGK